MSRTLIDLGPLSPLTFAEAHTALIGVIGFWPGRNQRADLAFLLAITPLVLPADDDYPTAVQLISEEPWYYLSSLLAFYSAGVLSS